VPKLLLITGSIFAGAVLVIWMVQAGWRIRSEIRRRAAGRPVLRSTTYLVWRHPGPAATRDLAAGPGGGHGAPVPPFHFIEEHTSGSQPAISIRDARGRRWRVKWGQEVHTEVFASRFAWAAGYFVETNYFLPHGTIEGVDRLQRARDYVDEHQRFSDACFELDEAGVIKHFDEKSWAWHDNPFAGSRELNGLKIVMMLLSNWDNKDVRDVARGSNTAIFEYPNGRGFEARYLIIDWGAALGTWGNNILTRGRWDHERYAAQTPEFVAGVDENACVQWGYKGQRTDDAVRGIAVDDVQWIYDVLRDLTNEQIAAGLRASGADETEIASFTASIRARIEQLNLLRHPAWSEATPTR